MHISLLGQLKFDLNCVSPQAQKSSHTQRIATEVLCQTKAFEAEDADCRGKLAHRLKRTHSNSNLVSDAAGEIAKRDGEVWEAVGRKAGKHGGWIYEFRQRPKFTDSTRYTEKRCEIFPAVEPQTAGYIKNLPEDIRLLGYSEWIDKEELQHCTLPDRMALMQGWMALRQQKPTLPPLNIRSDRGIADHDTFITAALSVDALLSEGKEFVHDHFLHIMLALWGLYGNSGYSLRRTHVRLEIARVFRLLKVTKQRLLLDNTLQLSQLHLQKLGRELDQIEIALGAFTDSQSAAAWKDRPSLRLFLRDYFRPDCYRLPKENPAGDWEGYLEHSYGNKNRPLLKKKQLTLSIDGMTQFMRRFDQLQALPIWHEALEGIQLPHAKLRGSLIKQGAHPAELVQEDFKAAANALLHAAKTVTGASTLYLVNQAKAELERLDDADGVPDHLDAFRQLWLTGACDYAAKRLQSGSFHVEDTIGANRELVELCNSPHKIRDAGQLRKLLEQADLLLDREECPPQLSMLCRGIGPDGMNIIEQFLELGFDLAEVDEEGVSAALDLATRQDLPTLVACAERFPNLINLDTNNEDLGLYSPLLEVLNDSYRRDIGLAMTAALEEQVKRLIDLSPNLDSLSSANESALEICAESGESDLVDYLLTKGAEIRPQALKEAYHSDSAEVFQMILNKLGKRIRSARYLSEASLLLHQAAWTANEPFIDALLGAGLVSDQKDDLSAGIIHSKQWDMAERLARKHPRILINCRTFRDKLMEHAKEIDNAELVTFIQKHVGKTYACI